MTTTSVRPDSPPAGPPTVEGFHHVEAALSALRARIAAEAAEEPDTAIRLMRRSEAAGVLRALGVVQLLGDAAARAGAR